MLEQWLLDHGNDAQFALFFSVYAGCLLLEVRIPKRRVSSQRKQRWPANLILTILNIAVLSLLPVSFFTAAVWAENNQMGLLNQLTLPIAIAAIANLLARGFISFMTHFLMHKIPWLWRIHRVHHLDTELDVTSTVRFHPLEFVVTMPPGLLLVVALGLSPWLLLVYELLDASVTVFSHANIHVPDTLDRLLRVVIVTPNLHRVHHSSWQPETDSNFSAVFPIWDIVFRTFRTQTREPQETMELGLEEIRGRKTRQLIWLLQSPFDTQPLQHRSPTISR